MSVPLVLINLYTVFGIYSVRDINPYEPNTVKILAFYWPQTMEGPVSSSIFWFISAKQKTTRELLNHEYTFSMTKLMYINLLKPTGHVMHQQV